MLASTATVTGQGAPQVDGSVRGGDFSWPPAGTSDGHQRGLSRGHGQLIKGGGPDPGKRSSRKRTPPPKVRRRKTPEVSAARRRLGDKQYLVLVGIECQPGARSICRERPSRRGPRREAVTVEVSCDRGLRLGRAHAACGHEVGNDDALERLERLTLGVRIRLRRCGKAHLAADCLTGGRGKDAE